MNDDELHRELERRAASAHLPRDWSRDELLPTVRSSIESRPAPVSVRGRLAPALAGLATVAALGLVLIVALPRFTPGSTPGPSAPVATLPTAFDCAPPADEPGSSVGFSFVVVDEAGVVASCEMSRRSGFVRRIAVSNPDGDESVLEVQTSWGFCDGPSLVLRRLRTGYSLTGTRSTESCPLALLEAAVRIKLLQPISARAITARLIDAVAEATSPISTPPAGPTPTPLAERVVVCTTPEGNSDMFVTDETDLIESCRVAEGIDLGRDEKRLTNPEGNLRVLRIDWLSRAMCRTEGWSLSRSDARLALYWFAQEQDPIYNDPSILCPAMASWLAIELTMTADVPADTILLDGAPNLPRPTPPTDPAPTPSVEPRPTPDDGLIPAEDHVVCGRGDTGPESIPFIADETGLVLGCEPWTPGPDQSGVIPGPDPSIVHLAWSHSRCHDRPYVLFERSGAAYTAQLRFDFSLPTGLPACPDRVYQVGLRVHLSDPIDASSISTSIDVPQHPRPSPSGTPSTTHVCAGAATDAGPAIELVDHLGVIDSCTVSTIDWTGEPVVVSDASRGVVRVAWEDGCGGGSDARLRLWPRRDDPRFDAPRYVLTIESTPPQFPDGCVTAIVSRELQLTFHNAALAPENLAADVETHLMSNGVGVARTQTGAGPLLLSLAADADGYTAGDTVSLSGTLGRIDDTPALTLYGSGSGLLAFGFEQLDGDAGETLPATADCVPHEVRADQPTMEEQQFDARHGITLPVGTHRVFAFLAGSQGDCSGAPIPLEASIVITVR